MYRVCVCVCVFARVQKTKTKDELERGSLDAKLIITQASTQHTRHSLLRIKIDSNLWYNIYFLK